MPPKKTSKAASSNGNAASASSKAEEEAPTMGIADMELPKSTVTRLAKSTLPEDTKMAKEVQTALVRASTVFISFLAAMSQDAAIANNNKTITAQHVLDAVQALNWPEAQAFQKYLKSQLKAYKKNAAAKKKGMPPPHPKVAPSSQSRPKASLSSAKGKKSAAPSADDNNEDVAMEDTNEDADQVVQTEAHEMEAAEQEQEEEDIDEGDLVDDEIPEEDEDIPGAFSEPEDDDEPEDAGLGDHVPQGADPTDW